MPRIGPPTPARSDVKRFTEQAAAIGLELLPWQQTAVRYLTARGPEGRHLYAECAIIVARQQGKSTLLAPLIVDRLRAGRRIMHTAQDRILPREVFARVADAMEDNYKRELRSIRFANGQEAIRLVNGGVYRIVAPSRSGARGASNDDVIIDELREMTDDDFIAAAKPTLLASTDPQMLYLSNAGADDTVVLNALKKRADLDPSLAYLEWSASPERAPDDVAGWLEANPALGHLPMAYENLEREYRANLLGETMHVFETEHLCRWVVASRPTIMDMATWQAAHALPASAARRPVLGISLDPSNTRASAAIAWQASDGTFGLELVADVTGDPIDLDRFGPDLLHQAQRLGVSKVVYDPYDEHLARHFRKPIPMNGRDFANACSTFVRLVEGRSLRWESELTAAVGADIPSTTKRHVGPSAWMAVRANEERPITALLAAIRAVGAAYRPVSSGAPRIL